MTITSNPTGAHARATRSEPWSDRAIARTAGILFIVATVASIAGGFLLLPAVEPDYLTEAAGYDWQIVTGALLEIVQTIAVVGIPITLYPVLRRQSESLALGFVVARIFEGVFVTIGSLSAVLLLTISQQHGQAGGVVNVEPVGDLLLATRDWSYWIGPMGFFSVSALVLYSLLYRSRLVPRWLAVWGLIGGALLLVSAVLEMYGVDLGTAQAFFSGPIGLNEMVLAAWLIVKGFNIPEHQVDSRTVDR